MLTLDNYRALFDDGTITSSLVTTMIIAIGGTILPIIVAALAAYAFAWLDFPGRDWLFIVVIAMLVVPLQMALIPVFSLYNKLGLFDTVFGIVLFHTAFGLPFAIFLLRNFFIGIPTRPDGGSADRRRLRDQDLRATDAPARACRRSPRSRSSSSSGRGTTCIVALTFGRNTQPITVAIFSQLRQFGANIDVIAPASFISLIIPARRLLRVPAVLRPGAAGGRVK